MVFYFTWFQSSKTVHSSNAYLNVVLGHLTIKTGLEERERDNDNDRSLETNGHVLLGMCSRV